VILHLKADGDFLSGHRLRSLVRRYSDFLDHPIELVTKDKDGEEKVETANQAS